MTISSFFIAINTCFSYNVLVVDNVQHEVTLKLAMISFVYRFVCSTQTQEGALECNKHTESGGLSREFKLKCIWKHPIIGLCTSPAVENTLCLLCLHLGREFHPGSTPLPLFMMCWGAWGHTVHCLWFSCGNIFGRRR